MAYITPCMENEYIVLDDTLNRPSSMQAKEEMDADRLQNYPIPSLSLYMFDLGR